MKSFLFLFISVVVLSCGDSRKIPDDFDYGKVENGVYKNAFFDMEVPIPDAWSVQSKEQVDALTSKGNKMIAKNNEELAKQIKASEITSAKLLVIFKYPADSLQETFNPSVMLLAENLGSISGIKTGDDYLEHVKKLMNQTNLGYRFPSEISTRKIGGKEFSVLRMTKNATEAIEVTQEYQTIIEKRFALTFITSSATDQQEEELRDALHKVKFK